MKTIVTTFFIIFIGITAHAQDAPKKEKVDTIISTIATQATHVLKVENKAQVARLYKMKNSLIKKELNFVTKANKPKMA